MKAGAQRGEGRGSVRRRLLPRAASGGPRAYRLDRLWGRGYAPRVRTVTMYKLLAASVFATACGAGGGLPPDTVRLHQDERSEIDRYLPLHDGVVFQYDTRASSGKPGMMTIQVGNTDAKHVELAFGGRRESLVLSPAGVRYADGGYWLKAPLSLDNSWDGRYGVARVVAKDVELTVPAGHFEGCIRIEENNRSQTSTTTTSVYCPQVGMVLFDVKSNAAHETAVLRQFGPRADPLVGEAPATAED